MDDTQSEILDFVASSLNTIKNLENTNNELLGKLAALTNEKIKLEKVASSVRPTVATFSFDDSKINELVSNLVTFNVIEKQASKTVSTNLKDDPSYALELIEILVKQSSSINEGAGVEFNLSKTSTDPHGWGKCVAGNK